METRCIHEMLPGQCSICTHHPDDRLYDTKAQLDPTHAGRQAGDAPPTTVAEFESRCPGCGTRIEIGDRIVLSLDVDVWVCSACGVGS